MQRARFDFDVITGPAFPRAAERIPAPSPKPEANDQAAMPRPDKAAEDDTSLSASSA